MSSSRLETRAAVSTVDPPSLAAREATLSPDLPHRLPFHYVEPLTMIADAVAVLASSLVSGIAYHAVIFDYRGDATVFLAVGVLVLANFCALIAAQHNYRPTALINFGRQVRFVTLTWWFVFTFLAGVAFTLKIAETFSRGATLTFFVSGWAGLILSRYAISRYLKGALERGGFAERRIVVITDSGTASSREGLINLRRCGFLPVRTFEISPSEMVAPEISKSLRRKIDDVISLCQNDAIECLMLQLDWARSGFIETLTRMLRVLPIPIHLLPDDNVASLLKSRPVTVGTSWTLELRRAPLSRFERFIKRTIDILGAVVALTVLSPVFLIVPILIKLDSKGPIFFKQQRNGFNGRKFKIYKFRSMRVLEDGNVILQAKRNDPRVTRIGKWLRRTSIDELPQLFNVLRGDMSLVGPRPHAVAHNDEYQKVVANYAFRHHVKPGITGWAQVCGFRGETQTLELMEQRVEHDLWYINHWSPWLDLRILARTTVLAYRQSSAY